MISRILLTAVVAGLLGGVFVWGLQMVQTTPLIVAAEVYEGGEGGEGGHDHHHAAAPSDLTDAHENAEAWAPADGLERHAYTLVASIIAGVGFALLLTGGIALSGRSINLRDGVLWGLAGFAAFYAAPSLGLPPELPGMTAADLEMRQVWWIATALFTAAGLGMLCLHASPWVKALGVMAILAPQLMGAPQVEFAAGAVPAELAAQFAVSSLVTTALFWIVLGGASGYFYRRFADA